MKIYSLSILFACMMITLMFSQCGQNGSDQPAQQSTQEPAKPDFAGFGSQVKWGEHLVTISGCNDCHTPKKMTPHGPDLDSLLMLSGHPSQLPAPDVNRKEMESKGLIVTNDLTTWVGPWGVSFTANLTSDESGIGTWSESQFMNAIRHGKFKGLDGSRDLLPPMPWPMYKHMTDDELKAIFAYLKSTRPVSNLVPAPLPPVSAPHS